MGDESGSSQGVDAAGPSAVFNLTGLILGKYRLVEKVGQGGMAQVYKAYQADLDRYVAVKVLHPHLTGDEDFAARFRREARSIAALEHPHIVRVYDFDEVNDLAYLVMEHVEGCSLKEILRDLDCRGERMEMAEVVRIVGALADALDQAHRQGLVHRDVKPSNVLIAADGRPVLTDFGIARIVDATVITGSGGTLGTPAYMSPEQGKGEPGDARSDVYALGVLLYQLCTGRVPFDADTPYAIILKHITAPLPAPRSLNPDLPESVERVILKALAKEPDERYQTAGELGQALQAAAAALHSVSPVRRSVLRRLFGGKSDLVGPAPSISRRRAILRGVLLVIGIALVGLVVWLVLHPGWVREAIVPPTPTFVSGEAESGTLILEGPRLTADTWLDPDVPDALWGDADLVHLQGPLTPDRLLLRFDLSGIPPDAKIVSATLTLKVELWGDQSLPSVAVAYRVLTSWEVDSATYAAPWSAPGLAAGIDYDSVPLDLVPVPDAGLLTLDVSEALRAWIERGQPNDGLVVMMSEDSHNMAHHWIYMSEQPDPADRPTLHVSYETIHD